MSKLRLAMVFLALLTMCHAAIHPRDGNSTSASTASSSTSFTFAIPTTDNQRDPDVTDWISVVCLRPDQMTKEQCDIAGVGSWIRCPNPDVSGILVRFSVYLANLLLGIVVMYDSNHDSGAATAAVWSQLVTVYSLLISAATAIGTHGLSRFHAEMTVFLVMSPLSTTLVTYACLGSRRLHILSSRGKRLPRVLVLCFYLIASGLMLFTILANESQFTTVSPCEILPDNGHDVTVEDLMFVPYLAVPLVIIPIIETLGSTAGDSTSIFVIMGATAPIILLIVAFTCAIIKARRSLAEQARRTNEQARRMNINTRRIFWVYWDLFEKRYPFLHFCGVFLVPMIYWVIANEIRLWGTPDNIFSPSFGQVLAIFVILPPLVDVVKMIPRAFRWFMNLTVIRLITRRERREPADLGEDHPPMGPLSSLGKLLQ
ncbi:hypothetical protein B0H13DRAFT_2013617 [Mycena leptocephala]|nr:hypothetical protein B0H13DRAFT_2013617 [Mycena leptocephala]